MDFVFPYNMIDKGKKIYIWGAGKVGRDYYTQIVVSNYCEVAGVIDKSCQYDDGIFKNKRILEKKEFDFVVVAVEKKELYEEILEDLHILHVSDSKIIWNVKKIVEQSTVGIRDLVDDRWEELATDYERYAFGDFSFFDRLIGEIRLSDERELVIQSFKKYVALVHSPEKKTVLLRMLLLADCFDSELLRIYMNGLLEINDPELVICLLYEIVWKELVHSEIRYPDYYNDRRSVIAKNTKRLLMDVELPHFPKKKESGNSIRRICYLRLNFPRYEQSNATRRNLAIANELSDRGYEVEEIFVNLLQDCNVKGIINFRGSFDEPADNRQYVHEGLGLYFPKGESIKEKILDILREIHRFDPDFIIDSCADYEMISSILINHYRILQIPCRNTNSCTFMDRCIVSSQELFEEDWMKYHSIEKSRVRFMNKYLKEKIVVATERGCDRDKYGIDRNAFVIATMGTRIGQELPEDMVASFSEMLKRNSSIVWLLVGNGDLTWIGKKHKELIDSGSVVIWGYEPRADDFWQRLDVKLLVSPMVTGNGGCAYRALYNGCPVLINRSTGDIPSIIGIKRCIEGGYVELADAVERMYLNPNCYKKAAKETKEIIKTLPTVQEYVDFVMECASEI